MFKITSLNSLSVFIKLIIGLVTSKLLAIFVGPSGMALVGNLRNFSTSLENISSFGFQNGIVKYVAESKGDNQQLQKIFSTAFIFLFIGSVILSTFLFLYATFWSQKLFGNQIEFDFVIKIMALVLPWIAVSVFFLSILNGLEKFKSVIWINIFGNTLGLIISCVLILNFKTLGALLALVITPALLFFVTYYFIAKELHFSKQIRCQNFDFNILRNLFSFSLMSLFSSVLGPLVFLAIRKNVIVTLGIEQAGYWETMNRISTYYLMFISTLVMVYFYPKLAAATDKFETKKVFWSFYKNILPLFSLGLLVLYYSRTMLVNMLLTKEFLPVTNLFFWQLVGDVLKVASLILGFQFFAKKMTLPYIVSECASLGVLNFASIYLINFFGIQGVVMAQAFENGVYLLMLIIYFRKSLF